MYKMCIQQIPWLNLLIWFPLQGKSMLVSSSAQLLQSTVEYALHSISNSVTEFDKKHYIYWFLKFSINGWMDAWISVFTETTSCYVIQAELEICSPDLSWTQDSCPSSASYHHFDHLLITTLPDIIICIMLTKGTFTRFLLHSESNYHSFFVCLFSRKRQKSCTRIIAHSANYRGIK